MNQRTATLIWLASKPEGANAAEMMKAIGCTKAGLAQRLRRLRDSGAVLFVGDCFQHGRWCVPRHKETAEAAYKRDTAARIAARRERRTAYEKNRYLRSRGVDDADESAATSWGEQEPEHRVVRAADAPPLPKRGPASAFELASWEAA